MSLKGKQMILCCKMLGFAILFSFFMSGCATVSTDEQMENKWRINMVAIPSGAFRLFDSIQRPPPMKQTVSSFYLSQYEITQEDYKEVVGIDRAIFGGNLKPVTVSWYEAIVFCNLLSIKESRDPVYKINGSTNPKDWGIVPPTEARNDLVWDSVVADWSKNGYRLPTDMEWRLAALGGQDVPNKEFAGDPNPNISGDDPGAYAVLDTEKFGEGHVDYGPHQVGSKKPNEFNLFDMTGNLSEWVWDWSTSNGYYLNDEINYRGPETPGVGTTRYSKLVRGTDWTMQNTNTYAMAVADFPATKSLNYGFRVAYYNY